MRHAHVVPVGAGLLVASLFALQDGRAAPTPYVDAYGNAQSQATDGGLFANTFTSQYQEFGSEIQGVHQAPGFSGSADTAARGTIDNGNNTGMFDTRQASDASSAGGGTYGALHGVAGVDTSVGDYFVANTIAKANVSLSWFDSLVFHTGVQGADYAFSITLADSLSTSVAPSAHGFYTENSTIEIADAAATTSLAVLPQTPDGRNQILDITDEFIQYGASADGPGPTSQILAPSRTMSGTIHVVDGETVEFLQQFGVGVETYNANATAGANASDTAYFDLFSLDSTASYTSASGTFYATSGDPDASGVTPPAGTVPEPAGIALMLTGFGGFLWFDRRRTRADVGHA